MEIGMCPALGWAIDASSRTSTVSFDFLRSQSHARVVPGERPRSRPPGLLVHPSRFIATFSSPSDAPQEIQPAMTPIETAQGVQLLTPEEIGRVISQKGQPAETLANLVRLIQQRFETDVCSVYLIEPDRVNLVLAATVGLRKESVGKSRMGLNEGLAGLVAEELRPIMVENATRHPRFKFFRESGEEAYRSFLGVPLIDQGMIQGVLVVQTADPRSFSREETAMLSATATQIAPVVAEARTLDQFIAPIYERIYALAHTLWWSWDDEAESLFNELDPVRWRELDHNPVALLSEISLEQLEERSSQRVLHSRLNYAHRRMQEYLKSCRTWGATHAGVLKAHPVAYFSAEFGIHESLPIYS